MDIQKIAVDKISHAKYNPRKNLKPGDVEYEKLKRSIEEFGYVEPVIWNKQTGNIVGGHQRAKILVQLGAKEIDCVVVDMDEQREKALNIALNKVSGDWDIPLLTDLLQDLDISNFDLSLTGFDDLEIDLMFEENEEVIEDDFDADKALDEIIEPITKPGDVWQLGKHRLMCGDSTMIDDVDRLMAGQKADVLFTDPPYGIDFKPQRGTHEKILNDALNDEDFGEFLDRAFGCALASMKPDTYAFIWTGWSKIGMFEKSIQKFFKIQALHIWVKNNFGIGYYSRPKHEPFYLCLNGKPVYPSKAPADVWEAARVNKTVHSCEKPILLIANVLDTYHKNSLVLDLFGGSGATLMVCEQSHRVCYMMELDEKYCDVIVKRYEEYTGQKAELIN